MENPQTTRYSNGENSFSEEELRKISGFTSETVEGKLVLDAGCRSGRFVDIFEKWGAEVIGVNSSFAIDSAIEILGGKKMFIWFRHRFSNCPLKRKSLMWYGAMEY